MKRRTFLKTGAAATMVTLLGTVRATKATVRELPEASAGKLPRWRGFNLLEKFRAEQNGPFVESDFEWLATWGFDFVRLPMDYRCWAKTPEAEFSEQTMAEIDQAVGWGKQYGVHVNLCFHRAPGYCVNKHPQEASDLWSDPVIQGQFARHWGVFSKRYIGIPGRQLSFDLVNEPPDIPGAQYAAAMKPAIDAIQSTDPHRVIIADGLAWGGKPAAELIPFHIAQSTRGYSPLLVSHYKASWMDGADKFPVPVWPIPAELNSHLYGAKKPEFQGPITLQVNCPQATYFSIRVDHVSGMAELVVKADGVELIRQMIKVSGSGGGPAGDCKYEYGANIPAGTREIQIGVEQGDWLAFSSIGLNGAIINPTSRRWAKKQGVFIVDNTGVHTLNAPPYCSKETLWDEQVKPWQDLAAKGVGVHVGEWGAFNHTPHDVVMSWMRDCLENWRKAGFGWALWNFRGPFGILDSGRKDVAYENFNGHQLDRQMLELLRAS